MNINDKDIVTVILSIYPHKKYRLVSKMWKSILDTVPLSLPRECWPSVSYLSAKNNFTPENWADFYSIFTTPRLGPFTFKRPNIFSTSMFAHFHKRFCDANNPAYRHYYTRVTHLRPVTNSRNMLPCLAIDVWNHLKTYRRHELKSIQRDYEYSINTLAANAAENNFYNSIT